MTDRTFHKYTITYEVLTETPITDEDMRLIVQECDDGADVGCVKKMEHASLNGAEAAKALSDAGSEPGFFRLDAEGNDAEEG